MEKSPNKNPKLIVAEYFSRITNEIDVEFESKLLNLHSGSDNPIVINQETTRLNLVRDKLINEIKRIENLNLNKLSSIDTNIDGCPVEKDLFKVYCIYLNKNILKKYKWFEFGALIVLDHFISDQQAEQLKYS